MKAALALGAAVVAMTAAADPARWEAEVAAAERAFARSMAERDHAAFTALLSEQAVFFTSPEAPLRGKAAVSAYWKRWFDAAQAPFSWEPDQVVAMADGMLAHSSGPVRNPAGQVVARFNSVWRQEAPGVWRVVFDRGEAVAVPKPD